MSGTPLRVLFAVWVSDRGQPRRGETYEHAHFLPALRSMGCEVTVFDLAASLRIGPDRTTEGLAAEADRLQPDLILCALYGEDLDPAGVRALSARHRTLNWFADDHWRFEGFSRRWAPCFTWSATTDRSALQRYADIGVDSVLLTQWAAATEVFAPAGRPVSREVSFVGQVYGGRRQLVTDLRRSGLSVETYGTGWAVGLRHRVAGRAPGIRQLGGRRWAEGVRTSTRIDQAGLIEVFETSRVNLNLSDSSHGSRRQIKARVFEVPACGGFLLTQDAEHLADFLEPGRDIAVFGDGDDLAETIRWWLEHEGERAAVAQRGLARVRAEHTYERRFTDLFHRMGLPAPAQG